MTEPTRRDTVLILGGGAREHALALALAGSPRVGRVLVSPGHAGVGLVGGPRVDEATGRHLAPIEAVPCEQTPAAWVALARARGAALTVVGPESALGAGVVDAFEQAGLSIFGPTRAAAAIETSKAWSRVLLERAGVRTPRTSVVTTMREAKSLLAHFPEQVVVKASGLTGGRGVFACRSHAEALGHIWQLLDDDAGREEVLVSTHIEGTEASVMALCDGGHCVLLPPVRDFKRSFDGDRGPNTGGMGACCPVPGYDPATLAMLERTVFRPIMRELDDAGRPFRGVLFAGLIQAADGFHVFECHARFGDPEVQALLPLLDVDLYPLLEATAKGRLAAHLASHPLRVRPQAAVSVVLAADGYPEDPAEGCVVPASLFETAAATPGVRLVGARLAPDGEADRFVNGGGRTLTATGVGPDLASARATVYAFLDAHAPAGLRFRRDIAAAEAEG
jgi:phosphoribosylamine--glycine ligase